MITPSPNGYRYVEASRQVWEGKLFLADVAQVAAETLAGLSLSATTRIQYLPNGDAHGNKFQETHITFPSADYEISLDKELKLVLLHAGTPTESTGWLNTLQIASQLEEVSKPPLRRRLRKERYRERVLNAALYHVAQDEIGHRAQRVVVEDSHVPFDRIGELPYPGKDRIFGLMPKADHLFTKISLAQAEVARRRLQMIDQKLAQAEQPSEPTVPFIRIPAHYKKERIENLILQLRHQSLPVVLKVGDIYIDHDKIAKAL